MTVKEQLLKRKSELESFVKHIEPRMLHLPEGNLKWNEDKTKLYNN